MQIAGAMAIFMMAAGGCIGMYCIYVQGREDEKKLTIIGASVFLLIFAVGLSVSAWAIMSEAT
jgi:hypothetical protein